MPGHKSHAHNSKYSLPHATSLTPRITPPRETISHAGNNPTSPTQPNHHPPPCKLTPLWHAAEFQLLTINNPETDRGDLASMLDMNFTRPPHGTHSQPHILLSLSKTPKPLTLSPESNPRFQYYEAGTEIPNPV